MVDQIMQRYIDCQEKAKNKRADENCNIYIPNNIDSLNLTFNEVSYHSRNYYLYQSDKIWGIGVMCGNVMHDMIKLDGGGTRKCYQLSEVKATGEVVYDQYMDSSIGFGPYHYNMTSGNKFDSYGYAECGNIPMD